jgi:hypothetical protein
MFENFQTLKSFNIWEREYRSLMTGHKNCLRAASSLFSKLNEITSVLQISVANQQGSVKKNFPLKLKIKAVCI